MPSGRRRDALKVEVKTEGVPTIDELMAVLDHAVAIGEEDPELSRILYRMAAWFTMQTKLLWSPDAKDRWRHLEVWRAWDDGVSYEQVFQTVSDKLSDLNHPAAAKADQIEKSYKTIQAALPPEQRRPRTHRPQRPVG
jgi:hypothetical protein